MVNIGMALITFISQVKKNITLIKNEQRNEKVYKRVFNRNSGKYRFRFNNFFII